MTISIAYSFDEAYIHHSGISILSLLENNRDIQNITIYIIHKDVRQSSLDLLISLINQYGRNYKIISFYDICIGLEISSIGRHIATIYSKLFFGRIEGIDKILYLDSDIIVNSSLKEFWETNLEENCVAGVATPTVSEKKRLNLLKSDCFINDGVVLINLIVVILRY
jgi:lipopolysaccharide biosynthesis glycosyltransferase